MGDEVEVMCPWCGETVALWVDADALGSFQQDCDVCCRPWLVAVVRDEAGEAHVSVGRE